MFKALYLYPFALESQQGLDVLLKYMQVSLLRFKSYKEAVEQHVDYDFIMVNLVNPEPCLVPDFSELQLMKEHKEKKKIIVFLDEKLNDDTAENLSYCSLLRNDFGVHAVLSPFTNSSPFFVFEMMTESPDRFFPQLASLNQGLVDVINGLFNTRPSQLEQDKKKRFYRHTLMTPPNIEGLYLTDLYRPQKADKLEPRLEISDDDGEYPLKLIWEKNKDQSSSLSYTQDDDTAGGQDAHTPDTAEAACRRHRSPSVKEIQEQKRRFCASMTTHTKCVGITIPNAARAYVLYLHGEALFSELKKSASEANQNIEMINDKIGEIERCLKGNEQAPNSPKCSMAGLHSKIEELKLMIHANDESFSRFNSETFRISWQTKISGTTPKLTTVERDAGLYDIDVMLSKVIELEAGNISYERLRHLFTAIP